MSFCFNPACPRPANPDASRFCQACGRSLLLANRYQAVRLLGEGRSGRTLLARDWVSTLPRDWPDDLSSHLPSELTAEPSRSTARPVGASTSDSADLGLCVVQQFWQIDPEALNRQTAVLAKLGQHPQMSRLLDAFTDDSTYSSTANSSTANSSTANSPTDSSANSPTNYPMGPGQSLSYLVQEFIAGQTLEEELAQQGPFSENQVRQLLADLLPVLRLIHSQQMIHGDIKPVNIIKPVNRIAPAPRKKVTKNDDV